MRIIEICDQHGLDTIRVEWETLLQNSASDVIFLTPEWISAWWPAYGKAGELRILAAYDESGRLRGIAPLRRKTVKG